MRKYCFAFLFLILFVSNVSAQNGFTTVSGAIVDPSGIPWTGGTISAQLITQGGTTPSLNGQTFTATTASGLLGPGGTFTMRLGDNGVIVPSTTTWQFTIAISPGVLAPFGKGPQSFTVTTAINCSTNTPTACASNAMTITTALTPVPALTFSAGGGLPAGLTFVAPTLTVSTAGSGNGCLALSGNTSGIATFCAPAVAGTSTNPVTFSNVLQGPNGGSGTPTYGFTNSTNTGLTYAGGGSNTDWMVAGGVITTSFAPSLTTSGVAFTSLLYQTNTNCTSSASPAVCAAAPAGSVVVAAAATTVQVNTTAMTANSQVLLTRDDSLGTKLSVTCNTATAAGDIKVSARSGGTSFTITVQNAPVTNPLCLSYWIIN